MRVYELADELNTPTQKVLNVLNEDLGAEIEHHMTNLDEDTARRVKIALQESSVNETSVFPRSRAKELFSRAMDSIAFGVGLGLLLTPARGDQTRKNIREEIRSLGREVTDPIKVGGEEVIDLLEVFPSRISHLTRSAVQFNTEQIKQIGPFFQGAFNNMINIRNFPSILSNGKGKSKTTQESQ